MPFATAWMDLEGIMLNEISQRKTNTILFQLYIESEKKKRKNIKKQTQIQRTNWWLPERDEEMKEIGKGDVEIQKLI